MGLWVAFSAAIKIKIVDHTALDKQQVPLVSTVFVFLKREQI